MARLFAALTGIALLECPCCDFRTRCGRQLDLHVEGHAALGVAA